MELEISEFVHTIDLSAKEHILFNSLFLKPVKIVGDDFTTDRLKDLAEEQKRILADHHILVAPGEDNRIFDRIRSLRKKPAINTCVLVLTEKCNMRCRYCFIEKNLACRPNQSSMSEETALKALRYFSKVNRSDSPSLVLYGGEPLVNRKVIETVLNEIEKMAENGELPRPRISINTNGTLIDEATARMFADHGVTVSISLDGTREQNRDRIFADGTETYDRVIEGIRNCEKYGVKYGISVTATPRLVSDYKEGIREIGMLRPTKVGINPLLAAGPLYPGYGKDVCDMMIESKRLLNDMGVEEDRLTDRLTYLENRRIKYHDCSAAKGEQIVIVPDGSVGICHEFIGSRDFFIGHIDSDKDVYENANLLYWVNRTPFNMEQCRHCPAIAVCGGGCPANAFQNEGDLYALDVNCCGTSERLLEWYFEQNPPDTVILLSDE